MYLFYIVTAFLLGKAYDERVDIFSFGIIVCEVGIISFAFVTWRTLLKYQFVKFKL